MLFVLFEVAAIVAVMKTGVPVGEGSGPTACELGRSAAAQELIRADVTCELSLYLADMLDE